MRRRLIFTLILITGLLTSVASPAHGPGKSLKRFIQLFDQNKDGQVTREEFYKGSSVRYKIMDGDKNGVITKTEFSSYYSKSREARRAQKFKSIDANSDGKMSFDEYLQAKQKQLKKRFQRIDGNKDGFITLEEITSYRTKFRTDSRRSSRIFAILDRNKDGKINETESKAAWSRWFKRLDRNKDQKITEDDLK
jgi:Ca2+-binding EF-hand superfamily protein